MPMNEEDLLVRGKDMTGADDSVVDSETKTLASTVARQILLVSDSSDSTLDVDACTAALTYLESIKTGNVGVLSQVSFLLVAKDWPLQVRIYASKMLQYLVKLRWDELSSSEQMDFSSASFELMSEVANTFEECGMKSETITLVTEMFEKEEDLEMWQELFLSLVSLSSQGPLQAELALEVVKRLSEHHIDHIKEELEDNKHRHHLFQGLPDILVWLHDLLEKHFGEARNAEGRGKVELAKQHSDAVVACLNTINSLTEWAPVPDFAEYKIIDQCASLLSSSEFCRLAYMFFKLICSRERPTNASSGAEFDSTISHICKIMVSLGSTNLKCIFTDSSAIALYLKQMLWFLEHYKFDLHYESLFFWLGLMDYLTSDVKAPNYPHPKGSAIKVFTGPASESFNSFRHLDGGKKDLLLLIDDETASKILDVSFQRMYKSNEEVLLPGTNLSLEPSKFEYQEFCQYQKRLFVLIRLISSHKPIIASTKLSSRTITLIKNISVSSAPCIHYAAAMKSQSTALEAILRRLFRGTVAGGSPEVHSQLHEIFEGLLQEFLYVEWTEPVLISAHVDYLNAMVPFLKYFPDTVGSVIDKMFALLTSLPPSSKRSRLYICSSLIRLAKTADKTFTPLLKGLADKMTCLQREGTLLPGEHSSLVEAFFAMTSASGGQREQDSFLLLLEPVRQQWTQPEWQNEYLSTPSGFIQLCSNAPLVRTIVDTVAVFEKALKGCSFKKRKLNMSETIHPLACHLSWMLPPLLKLFRVINSLSSPDVYQTLPTKLKEAMKMREAELHSVVQGSRSRPGKLTKGLFTYSSEGNANDIRNWLKAIRDSGFRVLNLAVTMGETFYTSIDANEVVVAFTENIWWMEFRHVKQLINSFVGCLVVSCPVDMWESLLEPLLSPLLTHCQRALDSSWTSLKSEGKANVPDLRGFEGGGWKKSIPKMERELLIDLSRSTSDLLSKISAPELNIGLPSLKHSDQLVPGDVSLLKDFNALKSNCLVSLLLSCRDLADSAMQFSLQACTWRDGITTFNLRCFFISVIRLAIATNNGELREFVAKDLFNALIMSLTINENVNNSSVLVGLCSEIFVYLSQRHPAPREVLLSFPCLTPDDLRDHEKALGETCEPKKQKQITRCMLSLALGISLKTD